MRTHRDRQQHNESYVIYGINYLFRYIGSVPQIHLKINSFDEIYLVTNKFY